MSGHTPGPWTGFLGGRDDYAAWLIGPVGARPIVAEVFRDDDDDVYVSGAEVEANARLIAAAPDLLESIRPYLRFLEGKAGTGWCMHDRDVYELNAEGSFDRLRAAIAKAEGRES